LPGLGNFLLKGKRNKTPFFPYAASHTPPHTNAKARRLGFAPLVFFSKLIVLLFDATLMPFPSRCQALLFILLLLRKKLGVNG
jgi:hypothetical protein